MVRWQEIILGNHKPGERSLVFKKANPQDDVGKVTAFWYIKLREFPPMEPLGGIVKVDFKIEEGELDDELIKLVDSISAEIYKLRLPSVYKYPRWPSYIYPIRIAEIYMSSHFSNNVYLSMIGRVIKDAISR